MPSKPAEIFFSYSHKDEPFREQLETHLSMLKRQRLIKPWHDRMITPGDEWKGQIDDNLNAADIILLLVTANFLASDYCYDIEMRRAMERHEIGEARVVPIILTPVEGWTHSPFAKLQVLPKDGKPLTKWDNRDEAFVNIAQGIRKAIESLSKVKPATQLADEAPINVVREIEKIASTDSEDNLEEGCLNKIFSSRKFKRFSSESEEYSYKSSIYDEVEKLKNSSFANGKSANLAYFDIDHFSTINEMYGEIVADEILRIIEGILGDSLPNDCFIRWGGDEFICWIESTQNKAQSIAKRLKNSISNFRWYEIAPELFVTASVGVASLSYTYNELTVDLIERAILGCRNAKRDGGNQVKLSPIVGSNIKHNRGNQARLSPVVSGSNKVKSPMKDDPIAYLMSYGS